MMPKMAQNRSDLHDVLAQGTSNMDITVCKINGSLFSKRDDFNYPHYFIVMGW